MQGTHERKHTGGSGFCWQAIREFSQIVRTSDRDASHSQDQSVESFWINILSISYRFEFT